MVVRLVSFCSVGLLLHTAMTDTPEARPALWKNERGHFLPGNKYGKGHGKWQGQIVALRRAWDAVATPEAQTSVAKRLLSLILTDPPHKDIAQLVGMWLDRTLGKVKDSLEVEVTTGSLDPARYTDEQLSTLLDVLAHPARRIDDSRTGLPTYEVEPTPEDES